LIEERSTYSRHTTIVAPVIHEIDDELDTPLLSSRDDVVEALEPIGARVDRGAAGGQPLEPHGARPGSGRDVVEAPDAQDLQAGALHVVERLVDVGVVGQEPDPVRIRACEIPRLPVDFELITQCNTEVSDVYSFRRPLFNE